MEPETTEPGPAVTIEPLTRGDWETVREIYREGIATGCATFETEAPDWDAWDRARLIVGRLVAVAEGRVLGWAALSAVSSRPVYAGVAEASLYVAGSARRRGVGTALLTALIDESERAGFWTLQGAVFPENAACLALTRRCGFREVGRRERIGCLHGVWKDTILVERRSPVVGTS